MPNSKPNSAGRYAVKTLAVTRDGRTCHPYVRASVSFTSLYKALRFWASQLQLLALGRHPDPECFTVSMWDDGHPQSWISLYRFVWGSAEFRELQEHLWPLIQHDEGAFGLQAPAVFFGPKLEV